MDMSNIQIDRKGDLMRFLKLALAFILIAAVLNVYAVEKPPDMVFYVGSGKAIISGEMKTIDENNPNVTTKLKEGRAFLPLRFISESSGAAVEWNSNDNKAVIVLGNDKIEIKNGSDIILKNGTENKIDVPAFEENSRLYIPVRAACELLGMQIRYERGLIIVADTMEQAESISQEKINEYIKQLTGINIVGNKENFDKLIQNNTIKTGGGGAGRGEVYVTEDSVQAPAQAAAPSADSKSSEFSDTNTQVEGVDEADIIKTDGTYIYKIANNKLYIIQAVPAEAMKQLSVLEFIDYSVSDMYIDGNKFVLIGSSTKYEPVVNDTAKSSVSIMPRRYYMSNTEVRIYNAEDKASLKLERSITLEGTLDTSRKIGGALYIVSNKNLWYNDIAVPFVKDGDKESPIDFSRMYYFPEKNINSYVIVSGIDINNTEKEVCSSAFLGSGNNVYVSQENMYVTSGGYPSTEIYKFAVSGGEIQFLSKGSVEGTVKNQFSMDEYDGYFRIATTVYENGNKNNVYILDQGMQEKSKITDIAPGEQIYSVRFMGYTGYMVTFRQVDPLFVIDMNPDNPKILGQLKIPGYSEYLHPYKDNYVIGFGKDATENGLYKGLKIALFDASDPANPKELFVEYIGDRGTDSAVLQNHKALMIMPELNMFALPVNLYEAEQKGDNKGVEYGTFKYQGGYLYQLTTDKGFELLGRITHLSDEDYLKSATYGSDYNKYIDRMLYIDGIIYSTSNQYITAHSLTEFKQISEIELK